MRNVLGCGSFLIVSGRVLLSDVSSPPREVRTPAADDDRRDGRDSPRRTGSARAVAPRTKTAAGRRRAAAGGPPGDTAPRAGHRPPPPRAPGPRPRVTASPSMGHRPEKTRQAGERPRHGRARRIRADRTVSGPAVGHRDQAQPPAPAALARRAPLFQRSPCSHVHVSEDSSAKCIWIGQLLAGVLFFFGSLLCGVL